MCFSMDKKYFTSEMNELVLVYRNKYLTFREDIIHKLDHVNETVKGRMMLTYQ